MRYIASMSKNEQRNFDIGYRDGLRETYRDELSEFKGYEEGYDAGRSDAPSLDDLTFDIRDEMRGM